MLIDFFYSLRAAKLPVSVKEYLTLLEALKANVIAPSLDEFYYLARITLVKDETVFRQVRPGVRRLFQRRRASVGTCFRRPARLAQEEAANATSRRKKKRRSKRWAASTS